MKILLRFNPEIMKKSLIAEVILETGVLVGIDRATIDATGGEMVAGVPDDALDRVIESFESHGVEVTKLERPIIRADDECVHCGACISVCPVHVFRYSSDWSVSVDYKECIQCGACVTACPHNALRLST
jgi:NAD-dependent dihydropyrimidine dehydrogenase PreA subunit